MVSPDDAAQAGTLLATRTIDGSGLLAISASYLIWYKGVQKLGATRTAVYGNLGYGNLENLWLG